ncbi:hypothetical protein SDC9_119794 [bioreactor metagenome]|uniref:Uncharacterized protein n=1 Tax=bioreactor metagenome TaxID=1076179 RepID=A0A645C617_9ZZZZ
MHVIVLTHALNTDYKRIGRICGVIAMRCQNRNALSLDQVSLCGAIILRQPIKAIQNRF